MHPEACHVPLIFRTIHSVYCSPPAQPGGTTSGHELWALNSACAPLGIRFRRVIVVVTGQFGTSSGELWMIAVFRLMPSFGAGPLGVGDGVYTGAGSASSWNACVFVHGQSVVVT